MNPGLLDRRVTILKRTVSTDKLGGQTVAWTPRVTVWARVQQVSGRKAVAAGQNISEWDYQITVRWMPGVDAQTTRLEYEGMQLELTRHPAEVGRRAFLEMLCSARPTSEDMS